MEMINGGNSWRRIEYGRQIPKRGQVKIAIVLVGRVFCKKGCDTDGETWGECLGECDEICYKDPVLKDQKWSAYIDRSPGSDCFRACIAGCGYKFEIPSDQINHVNSRSPKLPIEEKPASPPALEPRPPVKSILTKDEIPSTSA
ncbi:hypothetical protein F511_08579 [Dorcoceras hygrometricum]|uniref:Uncharacterized protein n=1 Tax=Dorcoceras hygrometricum TaxID=472368 RepID=A0A2Z7D5B2_9LAMI|nr:hypothetical protein F511_08579 [Dorcoceras hygrometricum]